MAVCRNVAGNLITPCLKPTRPGSPGRWAAALPELSTLLAELGGRLSPAPGTRRAPPVTSPGKHTPYVERLRWLLRWLTLLLYWFVHTKIIINATITS